MRREAFPYHARSHDTLLGKASAEQRLTTPPSLLEEGGRPIVQTAHPLTACGEQAYMDSWRKEAWTGFGLAFPSPISCYCRTLANWATLFACTGWRLCEMRERLHPVTGKPASVIFIVQKAQALQRSVALDAQDRDAPPCSNASHACRAGARGIRPGGWIRAPRP